jgi:hypothetical protein
MLLLLDLSTDEFHISLAEIFADGRMDLLDF